MGQVIDVREPGVELEQAGGQDYTGLTNSALRKLDFSDLLDEPATARTEQAIADRTLEAIGKLGQEEKRLRAELARR